MQISKELAYITGFILGDGNLSKSDYLVRVAERSKKFIENFTKIFKKVFDKKMKIYFDSYNNSYVGYIHCKKIWEFLRNKLEIPIGRKTRKIKVPEKIKKASLEIKVAFLQAIFDAEGSIAKTKDKKHPRGYLKIQLKMYNPQFLKEIHEILLELGFNSKLYIYKDFATIFLNGKHQCKLFLEKVGFSHPDKKKKLMTLLQPNERAREFR